MSTTEILAHVLDPFTDCLTREAAERILAFRPDRETQNRVDELAAKANADQLNDDERGQYQQYIDTFDLVAIIKAKARAPLASSNP
jgi:hypothetical protein